MTATFGLRLFDRGRRTRSDLRGGGGLAPASVLPMRPPMVHRVSQWIKGQLVIRTARAVQSPRQPPAYRSTGRRSGSHNSGTSYRHAGPRRPEISDSRTNGSTCRSRAKFRPERVPSKCVSRSRSISTLPMNFDDPFAGVRLFGREPNAGRRLRKHDLGQMPVQIFKLGLALEAEHDRVAALARLGDRRMKLRQASASSPARR